MVTVCAIVCGGRRGTTRLDRSRQGEEKGAGPPRQPQSCNRVEEKRTSHGSPLFVVPPPAASPPRPTPRLLCLGLAPAPPCLLSTVAHRSHHSVPDGCRVEESRVASREFLSIDGQEQLNCDSDFPRMAGQIPPAAAQKGVQPLPQRPASALAAAWAPLCLVVPDKPAQGSVQDAVPRLLCPAGWPCRVAAQGYSGLPLQRCVFLGSTLPPSICRAVDKHSTGRPDDCTGPCNSLRCGAQ